jgi:hypothetical protein
MVMAHAFAPRACFPEQSQMLKQALPLEGASVFAQNTTRGTLSDKEGAFKLYLEKGGYEIVVSFTGYMSKTINLELTGDRTLTCNWIKAIIRWEKLSSKIQTRFRMAGKAREVFS